MKRLVAIFIILVLTCFLFAGCDIVDSAIDGVDASKHNINNAISNLIHTHSYEQTVTEPVYGVDGYTTYTCACGDSYKADFTKYYSHGFGLEFNEDKTGYILMRIGYCDDKDIVIPPTYEGVPIIAIGDGVFGTKEITSVTIPDTVTSIGEGAFFYCQNLTSVTIPDSVTSIGAYAFYNCENLKSVTIGNGVTRIEEQTFVFCTNLQNVTIGNNVSYIGVGAFGACDSLTSISIPASVTSIGEQAFGLCSSLTKISVDENNPCYISIDGNLYTKDGKTMVQYAIGKQDASFSILDGVTQIAYNAFGDSKNLTTITIPDSVISIGEWAFSGCSSLANITIGNGVTSIGDYAFYNCSNLASITIPDSVTSIADGAFSDCSSLATINYCGTEAQWNAINKEAYWDDGAGNYTIVYNYIG